MANENLAGSYNFGYIDTTAYTGDYYLHVSEYQPWILDLDFVGLRHWHCHVQVYEHHRYC